MRYIIGLLILAVFVSAQAPDTAWTRPFGGSSNDCACSVALTADGGYIIAGYTSSYGAGAFDVWLLKTDAQGNQVWSRTFGGDSSDYAYSVIQTSDSGYVITGGTRSYSVDESDLWLIKTDAQGNLIWSKTFGAYGYDYGYSVAQTADGGYIITGTTESYSSSSDLWLIKTDAQGNMLWHRTFGGDNSESGYSVIQTTSGGYVITGETHSYGAGNGDLWLISTDGQGNAFWTKTFGLSFFDEGRSVQQTSDGGYIITGVRTSLYSGKNAWLLKTDGNGNQVWSKIFGGGSDDYGYSIILATDGGYIIGGSTESFGAGSGDVWLIKTDTQGDLIWSMTIGGSSGDYGYSVAPTADSGYVIAGITYSYGAGLGDMWLIKTEPDVGVEEEISKKPTFFHGATVISGPLRLPRGKRCRVFDISGREVNPSLIEPGIYFIETDDGVKQKIVKVR
ncbi:MAG TPA: hypothetical protein ENI34_09245 [candidate division WOR-3 bacterium]|uniref:T9SS type A sorting domain-containing protein n=1 Tax=candidate division WOR-3 bacterium TaxID=2052148 RepID=A0A9C9K0P1_UNCW3|nr:hypothetical protein [candidate division WOR-3 bacterium]